MNTVVTNLDDQPIPVRITGAASFSITSNDPGLPDSLGSKTSAGSTSVTLASDQVTIVVKQNFKTPTFSQISCTSSSTTLAAASATGQIVKMYNNGIYPIWVTEDGTTAPVADTAVYPALNGNGKGTQVQPGSYWSSDQPITTAVKGIALSTASLISVALYPN